MLFKYEYKLPILSPVFAAYSASFFEIISSFCLIIGFASRINAFILFIMSLIIEIFVFNNIEHIYWMFLLSHIMFFGPGVFAIDHFFRLKK